MAQVNFNDLKTTSFSNSNEKSGTSVGFFGLKNDGDEALVRIMHDSIEDFDILTTHPVTISGKHRRVSCVRDAKEPIEKCPFCAKGEKVEQRIYIHLLEYTKLNDGSISVEPRVWERPISYASKLKVYIENYGPLSKSLFKIRRCGAAGSRDTTYEINYAVPAVYPDNLYPNKPELLEGYKALGRAVLNKTPEDLTAFLTTGSFPMKAPKSATGSTFTPATETTTFVSENVAPQVTLTGGETRTVPWGKPEGEAAPVQAPVRYY